MQGALDTGFTPAQMVEFLRAEDAFVAVHTTTNELFRTGAIRGHFRIVPPEIVVRAQIDESQVVRPPEFRPPTFGTGSPGVGEIELRVNTENGRYAVELEIEGIDPVSVDNAIGENRTGIHVHRGKPDERGPIILDLHHSRARPCPRPTGSAPSPAGSACAPRAC